jgi:hypothetical protein
MIRTDLKKHINAAYRGSDDDVPAAGSADAILWDLTINRKISEWSGDSKNTWTSLFKTYSTEPGTVSTTGTTTLTGTGTNFLDYQVGDKVSVSGETDRIIDNITSDTVLTVTLAFTNTASGKTFNKHTILKTGVTIYNLHRRFVSPSNMAFIYKSDGTFVEYTIAKPQETILGVDEVYISGLNPQTITFIEDIPTDLIGLELIVPGYFEPTELTADTDTIPVDDPYWLVMSVAAELARNDLTYESKAPALNEMANALYKGMVSNNRKGTANTSRKVRTVKPNYMGLNRG